MPYDETVIIVETGESHHNVCFNKTRNLPTSYYLSKKYHSHFLKTSFETRNTPSKPNGIMLTKKAFI